MHERAAEFADALHDRHGIDADVREFPTGTKTADDAASAVGCDVGAIASSLVFVAAGDPIVVVTSGANRVDEKRLAARFGVDREEVEMADAETVREVTGWAIGGVPPLCHAADPPTLLDPALLDYDAVWAAAGTPESMFRIDPDRLRTLADATVADVTA